MDENRPDSVVSSAGFRAAGIRKRRPNVQSQKLVFIGLFRADAGKKCVGSQIIEKADDGGFCRSSDPAASGWTVLFSAFK